MIFHKVHQHFHHLLAYFQITHRECVAQVSTNERLSISVFIVDNCYIGEDLLSRRAV